MNAEDLSGLYAWTPRVVRMNTEGVDHAESLLAPAPAGNSLNWVIGHIVESRNGILELLGRPAFWSNEDRERYARGSSGSDLGGRALPLEHLVAELDRSQEILIAAIKELTPEDLARSAERGTLGDRLGFLFFHEAYHSGQTGLLRRLIGKPGAIG